MRLTGNKELTECELYIMEYDCNLDEVATWYNKLKQYEDVDESPEHLVKIKKALEIIKEKKVDMSWLYKCFEFMEIENISIERALELYNECYDDHENSLPLRKEEFDFLREELVNETKI